MKIIRTLDELDDMLAACDAANSDDALRAVFAAFRMDMATDAPADPFSAEYDAYQSALYQRIAGRDYSLANEATPFDVEQAVLRPFPYSTGSCQTAGEHYVTVGHFLRHVRLPPHSRIVEFGPGWGNLTLALAALGHRVTAVDVEPRFCELISRRAARMGLTIEVVNADFAWAASIATPFDAAIFFECFHHAADHRLVLRNLHRAIKPQGRVYMGAEPILADFPLPWGLRMDGQSLWSIRKFGWMELGFRDDYFHQALAATGWIGHRYPNPDPAIWELRTASAGLQFDATDPRLGTITGQRVGTDLVLADATAGAALFGPYVSLAAGRYRARIHFRNDRPLSGIADMDVCAQGASLTLARQEINAVHLRDGLAYTELQFVLTRTYQDIEVRLFNGSGFNGHITAIEITGSDIDSWPRSS